MGRARRRGGGEEGSKVYNLKHLKISLDSNHQSAEPSAAYKPKTIYILCTNPAPYFLTKPIYCLSKEVSAAINTGITYLYWIFILVHKNTRPNPT